jgi:hypothetical protein
MKTLIFAVLSIPMLLGTGVVHAAKCKYEKTKRDPVTNEKIIQTKWARVTNGMMDVHAQGFVSGVSIVDQKFLAIKLSTTDYSEVPEWYNNRYKTKAEKNAHKDRQNKWKSHLKKDLVAFPAGSVLRITMEDRSVVELATSSEVRSVGGLTMPNKEFKRKGFGGFLKMAVVDAAGADKVKSPHFRIDAEFVMRYALDDETMALLSNKNAINMRVESRDDYYYLGARDTTQNLAWGSGANDIVQNSLNCAASKK